MTSHTLNLWSHSPVTMERHQLCFWHYTQCIWHLTWWMNDNATTVSDIIPNVLCNQTHLIDNITPYVHMKSHPLHAWNHRQFIWHHIHSCWQHTIVCMSCYSLSLWNHMHYIWCLTCCVYDYPSSIPGLKPVKTAISSTLYIITPSRSKTSYLLCKASQVAYVYN